MKLKTRYWIFMTTLHIVLIFLVYTLLEDNQLLFVVGELLVIISLYFTYSIYQKLISPISFISSGKSAISDGDFQVKYMPVGSKEMDLLIETYNGMIDNLREERTQKEEQNFFLSRLIDKNPTGIVIMDFDGNVVSKNDSATAFLNIITSEKNVNFDLSKFLNNESKIITVKGINRYKIEKSSFIHLGFKRHFFIIHDLTKELIENEKKSYEKVIRMMAHEVNNTVGPVNSIMDSVATHMSNIESHKDLIESLHIAQDRNSQLNQFMGNFADLVRLPEPNLVPTSLNKACKDVFEFMKPSFEQHDILFESNITDQDVIIPLDIVLLKQALINILKNAKEAIQEKNFGEGKMKIELSSEPPIIKITDNGIGLKESNKAKLFTPFYSTKQNGQGIGLMLIKEILLKHNATFELTTHNNLTIFEIAF